MEMALRQLFVLVLYFWSTASAGTLGDDKDLSRRIVGGVATQIGEHPYIVNYGDSCGGTILSNTWILTAGHCGTSKNYIRVGSTTLRGGKKYRIARHFIHPKFGRNMRSKLDYDYQLIKLATPLEFSSNVQPIGIGEADDILPGDLLNIIGWGTTREGGLMSETLREAEVPVVSNSECDKVLRHVTPIEITDRMVCAGYTGGLIDSCQGDSGGPVVYNDKIVALVSFGVGCARRDMPGVYAKISTIKPWIYSVTSLVV